MESAAIVKFRRLKSTLAKTRQPVVTAGAQGSAKMQTVVQVVILLPHDLPDLDSGGSSGNGS